ncbi:hypothetical protein BC828DRAFT_438574 [Blastocladiella britannica]|nr:hypothetical protein BC828DRAFT_438574 [Blastocladiella britannica]
MSHADAHISPAPAAAAAASPSADPVDLYVRDVAEQGHADLRDLDDRDSITRGVRGAKPAAGEATATPTGWRGLLRTRRRKFMACCAVFVLLLVIFIPIAYFAIVPVIIRSKFSQSELHIYPNQVDVQIYASDPQVHLKMDADLYVGKTDMETKFDPEYWIVKSGDGVVLAELPMPEKITYIDKRYPMKMDSLIKLGDFSKIAQILKELSSSQGISDSVGNIEVHSTINAHIFGIKMPPTDAIKNFDFRGLSFDKLFANILNSTAPLPGYLGAATGADPTLKTDPRPATRAAGPLHINGVSMTTTDKGFSINADFDYDNPTPFAAAIDGVSLVVKIYDTPIARVGLRNINLVRGKGNMKPSIDLELLSDYTQIGTLLRNAVMDFFGKNVFPIAVSGPVKLTTKQSAAAGAPSVDAVWVSTASAPLAVAVPPAVLAQVYAGSNSSTSSVNTTSLLADLGIHASVSMDANAITVPLRVVLPSKLEVPDLTLDYALGLNVAAGLNATFMSVGVDGVSLARAQGADHSELKATVTIKPDSSAGAISAVAQLVEAVLYGSANSQVTLKNIAVTPNKGAAQCAWCHALFDAIDFPVPIQPIPLKSTLKSLVSAPATGGASTLKIGSIDVKQEADSPAITVTTKVDLGMKLPIIDSLNLPFAKVDLQVDDSTILSISLPAGVNLSGSSSEVSLQIRATFANGGDVQSKVAALVNRYLGTQDGASKLAVTGINFGVASAPFKTFEGVNVHLTSDDVKDMLYKKDGSSASSGFSLPAGLLKPTGLDVAMTGANELTIGAQAVLQNPFPVSASIGSLSLSALLNDQTLATISLPPISLTASGQNTLDLKGIKITLGTSGALPATIGDLVGKFMAGQPLAGSVGVTGITLGSPSGKADAGINTLAAVKITKDIPSLVSALSSSGPSIIDTSAILPAGGLSIPAPKLVSASVATQAGAVLSLSASLDYTNPLPVSINLPFVSLSAGVDNAGEIAAVSVGGLNIQRNSGRLAVTISLAMNNDAKVQDRLAQIVSQILGGKNVDGSLIISKLVLGSSPKDTTPLFSAVSLPLPLSTLVNQGAKLGAGNNPNAESPLKGLLDGFTAPKISDLSVVAGDNGRLTVSLAAAFKNPLPVSIDIGYLALQARVSGQPVVGVSINGLKVAAAGDNKLQLAVQLDFVSAEATQQALKKLVSEVLYAKQWTSTVGFGGAALGVSPADSIQTFSRVGLDLPLTTFITPEQVSQLVAGLGKSVGGGSSLTSMIQQLAIAVKPKGQINVQTTLNLGFPAAIDVGFVTVTARLNRLAAVVINVNGIKTAANAQSVSLNIDLFVQDSPALEQTVAALVQDFLLKKPELPYLVGIAALKLGKSPSSLIETFAAVEADLPLSLLGINGHLLDNIGSGAGGNSTLPIGGLSDISVKVQPKGQIDFAAVVALKSFPLTVDVGYLAISLGVNKNKLLTLAINGIQASPKSDSLKLSASLNFSDAADLETDLRDVVLAVLQQKPVPGQLVISGLKLGTSPDDTIGLFSAIIVALPFQQVIGLLPAGGLSSLPLPALKGINNVKLVTLPGGVIQAAAAVSLDLPFKATVSVPFVGMAIAIDKVLLAKVGIQGISITPDNAVLQLSAQVLINDTEDAQNTIAALVKSVLFDPKPTSSILMITGLHLGVSPDDFIGALQQVVVPIPLAQLLTNVPKTLPSLPSGPLPFSANNVSVSVLPGGIVDASLNLHLTNLTFPADISVPFIQATIGLNSHRMVTAQINGLKISPTTKDLALSFRLIFSSDDTIQTDLATLIDEVFNKKEVTGYAFAAGIEFGASEADHIRLLSKTVIALPLTQFSKQLDALPETLGSLLSGVGSGPTPFAIKAISVAAKPSNVLELSTTLALGIQFPLSVNVPFINVDAKFGPIPALSVQISGVVVTPATKELSLGVRIIVGKAPQLAQIVAKVASEIAAGNFNQIVTVTGAALGASDSDRIATFSRVALPINLAPFLNKAAPALPSTSEASGILAQLNPQASQLKVATLPNRVIAISAQASFANNLPVSVDVGYLSVGVGLDGERVADIRVRGFTMKQGQNGINLDLSIQLSQGNADVVGKAVMDVLQGKLDGHRVTILGAVVGASETDNIQALSLATIDVAVGRLTTADAIAKLRASLPGLITGAAGNGSLPLSVTDLKVNMANPGPIMIQVAADLKTTAAMDVQIGFFQAAFALGPDPASMPNPPLLAFQLRGLSVANGKLGLTVVLNLFDTDGNENIVAAIVGAVLGGQQLPDVNAFVAGFSVGASDKDKSDILSKTALALPVRSIIKGPITLPSLGDGAMPKITPQDVSVQFVDKYTIRVGASVSIDNPTPLSLSVGYVAASIAVNGMPFGSFALDQPLQLSRGTNNLALSVQINLSQDPKLEDAVAQLVQALVAGQLKSISAGVTGLVVGANKDTATHLFAKAQLAQTISLTGVSVPSTSSIKLGRVKAALDQQGAHAAIPVELPFKFTLSGLSTLNVKAFARGNPLAIVAVSGLSADKSNKLDLNAQVIIVPQVAAPVLSGVYEAIKAGQPISGLSIGAVNLGLANGDTFSLLSKISAALPETKIDDIKFQVKVHNLLTQELDTKTLLNLPIPMDLEVGGLKFDVFSPRKKAGEVHRHLTVHTEDGGFVVRIHATLGFDLIELGKLVTSMETEDKFLKNFQVSTMDDKPIAWANTVFNAINIRLKPQWVGVPFGIGRPAFDSPGDVDN